MLLIVKKGIRDGKCHAIHQYAKPKTHTWKLMMKIKNHHSFWEDIELLSLLRVVKLLRVIRVINNFLVSESNYHTNNFSSGYLLYIETKKHKHSWIKQYI